MHNETSCDAQAHYSYIGMLYSSYVHLLKVVFGVESACDIYICILQQVQFL